MRLLVLAVACSSWFGCGEMPQMHMDVAPEIAMDVSVIDAVDVPPAMDIVSVDVSVDVPSTDVTCVPECFFFEDCIGGKCVARPDVQDVVPETSACAPMQTLCVYGGDAGSRCYDLQTSWERCGACDVQCAYDSIAMMRGICAAGICVCRDSAFTACPSPGAGVIRTLMICANLQNDAMNCGSCGTQCTGRNVCRAGRCTG